MKVWLILSPLVFLSIATCSSTSENESWLSELAERVLSKLSNLQKKMGIRAEGVHEALEEFIDDIKGVTTKVKEELPYVEDMAQGEANEIMAMFREALRVLQNGRKSAGRNKRVIKEFLDTTKKGIDLFGDAVYDFYEALKPIKDGAVDIALEIQRDVDKAADKLIDAIAVG